MEHETRSEAARLQIYWDGNEKKIMAGVSAQFAMSRMDDIEHPECEVYVEDAESKTFITEILSQRATDLLWRVQIMSFGAARMALW